MDTDRVTFWSTEAIENLLDAGRQDLIDRGDAYAERLSALLLTAKSMIDDLIESGKLYNRSGGANTSDIMTIEYMINIQLKECIDAIENMINKLP